MDLVYLLFLHFAPFGAPPWPQHEPGEKLELLDLKWDPREVHNSEMYICQHKHLIPIVVPSGFKVHKWQRNISKDLKSITALLWLEDAHPNGMLHFLICKNRVNNGENIIVVSVVAIKQGTYIKCLAISYPVKISKESCYTAVCNLHLLSVINFYVSEHYHKLWSYSITDSSWLI